MNRLVTQVELPSDFIPYYITRCTKTCEDLEVNTYPSTSDSARSAPTINLFQGSTSTGTSGSSCMCLPACIDKQFVI